MTFINVHNISNNAESEAQGGRYLWVGG